MSPRMVIALNVAFLIFTTLMYLGPLLILLWFSWRSVITAALLLAAFSVFMFSLLMAGGGGGGGTSAIGAAVVAIGIGTVLALALAGGAFYLARNNLPLRGGVALLALLALAWAYTGWGGIALAWEFVGSTEDTYSEMFNPPPKQSKEKRDQATADQGAKNVLESRVAYEASSARRDSAPRAPWQPDSAVSLRDADGRVHRIAIAPNRDLVTVGARLEPEKNFLKLIEDPQMQRWLEGREMILVVHRFKGEGPERNRRFVPMEFVEAQYFHPLINPGFYHVPTGTFSTGVYRWMRDVLRIPQPVRDELYLRYHDMLPN